MKKVISVSVSEGVLDLAWEAAYQSRMSFSSWVEEAMLNALKKPEQPPKTESEPKTERAKK